MPKELYRWIVAATRREVFGRVQGRNDRGQGCGLDAHAPTSASVDDIPLSAKGEFRVQAVLRRCKSACGT